MRKTVVLFLLGLATGLAQVNTSTLDGLVTDPQGAFVPKVEIVVTNTLTTQIFKTVTDSKGHWAVPSLPTAAYSITATAPGFKTITKEGIKMDAGIPATVNLQLEVGAVTETVEVSGAAEVVQAASATVSSDLTGRQVNDLPIPSRNATDLIVTLPGTQTPGGPRNTTFDGLPQATVNMTMDGVNIQDNLLKNGSGGAFYPIVYPRTDAVEEVSVTSAASGAESLGEGAIQVKFVTKSGTNEWHGGAFMQERNTYFDANTYFNNIDGLPRDRILLHQWGAHIGGPILKKKLFIFFNYEIFRFPQSWNEAQDKGAQLLVLTDPARQGLFTYKGTGGQLQTVNLYTLAAGSGFPSTPDPRIGNTLSLINQSLPGGTLTPRITANDYNRNYFNFMAPGEHKIDFPQGKLDWVINSKHHWEATGGVNPYRLFPDGINGVIPVFPGSGTVLGSQVNAGQREAFWTGSTALRSAWSSYWTSEIRFGMSSGNVLFFNDVTPNLFSPWRGFAPNMAGYVTVPYNASSFSRRNNPIKQLTGSASWAHGSHLVNMGGSFSQINEWTSSDAVQVIPRISFGIQNTDPALSMFNSANFPGSASSDLANAENLYALLTGRVSAITQSVVLGEQNKTYGPNATIGRLRVREFGLYVQDSWKVKPNLTVTYGFRLENQYPFHVFNNTYTRPGYAGLYGISGVGNLFQPGATGGAVPVLTPVTSDTAGYSPTHFPSPTVGVAYVLPKYEGLLGKLAGRDSVLRAGFAIASVREQFTVPWSNNQGVSLNTSVDPISTNTAAFGPAGSVLFNNPVLPAASYPSSPTYPLAVLPGNSIFDYNPDLKSRYVESWNVGFQRSLSADTVLEVRYVANRSARAWTSLNLNEVNVVENGFNTQFLAAQNNLAIANGVSVAQLATLNTLKSTNFFNTGLPGQQAVPIISTALANSGNSQLANWVAQGQTGALANSIAGNTAQMARLVAANYPANLFQANPATGGAAANITANQGGSTYNSMQVELRRRLAKGVLAGASYAWSHSLYDGNILSLRDMTGVTYPSPFDQRHTIKLNWIYELPWGPGRQFLSSVGNPVIRKAVEGWQISGITRLQSGTPSQLLSNRQTFNTSDSGVVLHNLTTSELQGMMSIQKQGNGIVNDLPQSLITNTLAAFQLVPTPLDPNAPYIGPANTPGQFGDQVFMYGPWFQTWDVSLAKRTKIGERQSIEFRAQALNIFNHPNFFLVPNSSGNITMSNLFGQTRNAYNDINSTNDPGSRILEFQLRYSF
ncbi:MAG: carboxypeptidase regulatory-like domain-containing protein [Candidatus Sulfopaludibacter sp.]|nr:carboxypeptidase regulatory-like domain-containing protein [Candidatus Sulfopaludibacter sp.]